MYDITNSISKIRFLDELAYKKSAIHSIHPLVKLILTVIFIIMIISYDKYEIVGLISFVIYPVSIFILAEIPAVPIIKRIFVALPLIIGIGIFNPIFDKQVFIIMNKVFISGGWISFISLLIKYLLTVISALLLVSTTSIENIGSALRKIYIPRIIVIQLFLIYRYIYVLLEEGSRIWTAYILRSPKQKGLNYKAWGSLLGQMLIRSFDRAQTVYQAMILRGFEGEYNTGVQTKLKMKDWLYLCFWTGYFLLSRYFNIPLILGKIITGVRL